MEWRDEDMEGGGFAGTTWREEDVEGTRMWGGGGGGGVPDTVTLKDCHNNCNASHNHATLSHTHTHTLSMPWPLVRKHQPLPEDLQRRDISYLIPAKETETEVS